MDFFLDENQIFCRIPKAHTFSKIYYFVQNLYDRHNKNSLGIQAHNIITNNFINKFDIQHGIIPIARELPVWKELDTIALTGHIDILAYYYINDTITFLILDFKPRGKSGILRSIPQLTIYGILFRELFFNTAKDLKFDLSQYKINIKSIGFNHRLGYIFDPFKIYNEILDFVDQYDQKGLSILRNIEYFKNLITN
ncbi:MAG: hypothetical protein EU533_00065 [Promethearchaeota archaeon]|nr:MAG: hypothetical protein EU533_00065 [Candidatus Lokiarchaeota archaeon]